MKQLQYPYINCNFHFHFKLIIENWPLYAVIAIWETCIAYFQQTQLASKAIESVKQPQGYDRLTTQVHLVSFLLFLKSYFAFFRRPPLHGALGSCLVRLMGAPALGVCLREDAQQCYNVTTINCPSQYSLFWTLTRV